MPANILNLPWYKVLGITENEHDYHIEAVEPPTSCPHCQSSNLVGFGRREQMVKDLPMHGRRVGLYIDTRRYRCRNCGKTFYEALPEIDEKRLMTKRLALWMGKQAIKRTFASIAEEVGCTEFTVRSVFSDYVNELEKTIRFETPKWMGIDEIHLIKPRGVIANIQNNTIIELLPNRNKDTVARFLRHLECFGNVARFHRPARGLAPRACQGSGKNYNPRSESPGCVSGRRPSGQWNLRSASTIGRSLILA